MNAVSKLRSDTGSSELQSPELRLSRHAHSTLMIPTSENSEQNTQGIIKAKVDRLQFLLGSQNIQNRAFDAMIENFHSSSKWLTIFLKIGKGKEEI